MQTQLQAERTQTRIAPARAFHEQVGHDGIIRAAASACGGIGATSFVLNLASLLTKQDKKDRTPVKRVAVVAREQSDLGSYELKQLVSELIDRGRALAR